MAEETDLDAGGKRRRPTARDIGLIAGREGARQALIPLGVDLDDSKSLERWHAERAFTRKEMKREEEGARTFRKVLITVLTSSGLAGLFELFKNTFHIGG